MNSPLVTYTKLSPHMGGARAHRIDRITVHCVVGQCSIEALGAEFCGAKMKSSNYGIGSDGRVGMFVSEDRRAMTSSSAANDDRAVTIECASDVTAPHAFNGAVYAKLIDLCTDICRRNGKTRLIWMQDKHAALGYEPAEDEMVLTCHRWFAATACPGEWMMAHMDDLARQVTERLEPWYSEAMQWAAAAGLIRDGRPGDPVTRAELATVLQRFDARLRAAQPEDGKSFSGLLED